MQRWSRSAPREDLVYRAKTPACPIQNRSKKRRTCRAERGKSCQHRTKRGAESHSWAEFEPKGIKPCQTNVAIADAMEGRFMREEATRRRCGGPKSVWPVTFGCLKSPPMTKMDPYFLYHEPLRAARAQQRSEQRARRGRALIARPACNCELLMPISRPTHANPCRPQNDKSGRAVRSCGITAHWHQRGRYCSATANCATTFVFLGA